MDWLEEIVTHCFDLDNFPECEAKAELEVVYWRLVHLRDSKR